MHLSHKKTYTNAMFTISMKNMISCIVCKIQSHRSFMDLYVNTQTI